MKVHEPLAWHPRIEVATYDLDQTQKVAEMFGVAEPKSFHFAEAAKRIGLAPVDVVKDEGNLLLNAGIQRLIDRLIGAGTALSASVGRIGVGTGTASESASQTDLQGASKYWALVDTAPTRSSQTLVCVATFATGVANFAWEEWGIDFGTSGGATVTAPLLNRKVVNLGTKSSSETKVFTVNVTLS